MHPWLRCHFSLLELCTALAVVTVLTSMALPQLREMELEAKLAEVPLNVDDLRGHLILLWSDEAPSADLTADMNPGAAGLTRSPRPWQEGDADWEALAWRPDGSVRCSYAARYESSGNGFQVVVAWCDLDGDGQLKRSEMTHHFGSDQPDELGGSCSGTGQAILEFGTHWENLTPGCW